MVKNEIFAVFEFLGKFPIAFSDFCVIMWLHKAVHNARLCKNIISVEEFTMAYKITDDCVACGSCADACPMSIITEGDGKYVINADECVSCGSCADACGAGAIVEE